MRSHSKTLLALAIASTLVMAAVLAFKGKPAAASAVAREPPAAAPAPALTVSTETPQTLQWPRLLAAHGSVAAWREASIGSELPGLRLSSVNSDVGDTVRGGQVLAVLASAAVAAELAQAEASVTASEARLAEATVNADGARRLRGTGALSEQQMMQLLTAERTAQAELEVQRAAAQLARLRWRQTRVLAPDDGVISARTATVGSVAAASQELFRMIVQGRLEWRAEVASHELSQLRIGMPVRVQDPSGATVTGSVRMIAPNVDPQTRLGLVHVELSRSATLRAGMFAPGEFELGPAAAVTVSREAVVLREGFSYVFALGAQARVAQTKVTIGRRHGDRIELIGIAPDRMLVSNGVGFLNDGDVVKVVHAAAVPARP